MTWNHSDGKHGSEGLMKYALFVLGLVMFSGCNSANGPVSQPLEPDNLASGLVVPNPILPMPDAKPITIASTGIGSNPVSGRSLADLPRLYVTSNYQSGVKAYMTGTPSDLIVATHGNASTGVVVLEGIGRDHVQVRNANPLDSWMTLPDLSLGAIISIAGDNTYGPLVFGGMHSKTIAFVRSYAVPYWTLLTNTAPFEIGVGTGDNQFGAVIAGAGENAATIYFLQNYSAPQWVKLGYPAPFPVLGMTGDNLHGVIVYGANSNQEAVRVAYVSQYSGAWTELPNAPAPIVSISGENVYGPVILCSNGSAYFLRSYANPMWEKINAQTAPCNGGIAGNNRAGIVVFCN